MGRRLFSMLALGVMLIAGGSARADFTTTYETTMNPGTLSIGGIVLFEKTATGGSTSWPYFVNGGSEVANFSAGPNLIGLGTTTIFTNGFPSADPKTSAFAVGVSYDGFTGGSFPTPDALSDIAGDTKHLVVFTNTAFAASIAGQDFSASGYDEAQVISWVEVVGQLGVAGVGQTTFDENFAMLSGFADAADAAEAWFAIPTAGSEGLSYAVTSFSSGVGVGNGIVTQNITRTPEPSGIVLALAGIAGMVVVQRRRRG